MPNPELEKRGIFFAFAIDLQKEIKMPSLPTKQRFQSWIASALSSESVMSVITEYLPFVPNKKNILRMTIRLVDEAESSSLNEAYRQKKGPTNVLSFPFETFNDQKTLYLGDLVICAPLMQVEALNQKKEVMDHYAHIAIHGFLHLLGFDHIESEEAEQMELIEANVLAQLSIANPYI